jgi:phosphoribosylanthranilate isomerase
MTKSSLKIKICGLTQKEDLLFLQGKGVDLAGFIFVPGTPRFLERERAKKLTDLVPAGISAVGVFLDEAPETVWNTAESCRLKILQFHGREKPEYCEQFGLPYFKTIRVARGIDPVLLRGYRPQAFLLDTFTPQAAGGTGQTFDWPVAAGLAETGIPIILAGGLNPENIARAVAEVKPWGVDVSSGVEIRPGIKNLNKIDRFVQAARRASSQSRWE